MDTMKKILKWKSCIVDRSMYMFCVVCEKKIMRKHLMFFFKLNAFIIQNSNFYIVDFVSLNEILVL